MAWPSLKGLWVGGGVDYNGRSAGDPRNRDFYMPAYTIWNAAIGYDWTVNTAKITSTLNFKNIRDVAFKATPQSIGEPRRIQLACTLHF